MTERHKRWLGAAFWMIVMGGVAVWMLSADRRKDASHTSVAVQSTPAALFLESLWSSTESIEMVDPTGMVDVGDVAFAPRGSEWREVGYISAVRRAENSDNRVTLTVFDAETWSPTAIFQVHRNSGRIGDVMATLLPPEKRERLQQRLTAALEAHAEAVGHEILPLVAESIQTSVPLIESALSDAMERHRAEIDALVARYRAEILKDRIAPMIREEVMPVVRKHATEPAETIGREIWDKASLWRFGWRAMYDKSPLPERELLALEWDRFVEEEVTPVVEAHFDEIAAAVENMIKDLAANKKLRSELAGVVHTISQDPQARALLRTILREAVVDNEQLRQAWSDVWTSPAAQARLRRTGKRLEPLLREIGDEVMGTREEGIEPGFARVLRNQILSKDRTWITITPAIEGEREGERVSGGEGEQLDAVVLRLAERFMPYPVIYLAQ